MKKLFIIISCAIGIISSAVIAQEAKSQLPAGGFANVVAPLLPAVVNIQTTNDISKEGYSLEMPELPDGHPFKEMLRQFEEQMQQSRPRKATALGSGFIIHEDGYIVTCNHVIAEADEITVILNGEEKEELKAKIIGRDPRTDLALLKVNAKKKLPYVKWGDSSKVRVGDWVIAIGNPFGLSSTVTHGIISTIARDIAARSQNLATADYIDGYLQTDASINVGNSGGPMFDERGYVIGINSAILSPSGGNVGIGFAVPSNLAVKVIDQLRNFGRTKRGWLGVKIQNITPEIAEAMGLAKTDGALIGSVTEKSPAMLAGIKPRDIIISYNGKNVKESNKLPHFVGETEVGTTVPVEVLRDGKKVTLKVKIAEFEQAEEEGLITQAEPKTKPGKSVEILGMRMREIESGERKHLPQGIDGVLITRVNSRSEARDKGIRSGDIIVEVSKKAVKKPEEISAAIAQAKKQGKKNILILLARGQELRYLTLPISDIKNSAMVDDKDELEED